MAFYFAGQGARTYTRLASLTLLLLLTATRPGRAQTIPELYDQIEQATQQKQFANVADLYTTFFEKKRGVVSWDYFRAAQASASAQRLDAAFEYLDKMVAVGWLDDGILEKDASLQPLHTDSRWPALLARLKAAQVESQKRLDPVRVGLAGNPALGLLQRWAQDLAVNAETLYSRLTAWDQYPAPTESGRFFRFENKLAENLSAPYFVYVPRGYNPRKPTGVLVWLRGGIGAVNFPDGKNADYLVENPLLRFLDENNLIEIFPEGNNAVFWTRARGMQNITDQLTAVRKILNVDDDRIFLAGFSNGGSGVYAFALNAPSLFAGFFSINGAITESVFVPNLSNRPLTTLASEKDDYSDVPAIKRLQKAANSVGAAWTVTELPGQEHYYRAYEDDAFPPLLTQMKTLKRDPLRRHLAWEVTDTEVGRCDWLQIEALNLTLPRAAWHTAPLKPNYVVERNGRVETRSVTDDSGAVRAEYADNRFTLQTSRVQRLTLWLHPAMVDFNRPVEVLVNGKRLFHAKVVMDKALIADQFSRQFDRTQLFAARISLDVTPHPGTERREGSK